MQRTNISSGGRWEPVVGYSRAVRVGPFVHVAGTTSANNAGEVRGIDADEQAVHVLKTIERALVEAGAGLRDVVRTRVFLKEIDDFEAAGRAHREFFGDILPANTTLVVKEFASPDMLVEIEAEAIVDSPGGPDGQQ